MQIRENINSKARESLYEIYAGITGEQVKPEKDEIVVEVDKKHRKKKKQMQEKRKKDIPDALNKVLTQFYNKVDETAQIDDKTTKPSKVSEGKHKKKAKTVFVEKDQEISTPKKKSRASNDVITPENSKKKTKKSEVKIENLSSLNNDNMKLEASPTSPKKKKSKITSISESQQSLSTAKDISNSKSKNKKKSSAEKQFEALQVVHNTTSASSKDEFIPPVTPMKRKERDVPETPFSAKRKVIFNLKKNTTQHFDHRTVISQDERNPSHTHSPPSKGLLKAKGDKIRKKRKIND